MSTYPAGARPRSVIGAPDSPVEEPFDPVLSVPRRGPFLLPQKPTTKQTRIVE